MGQVDGNDIVWCFDIDTGDELWKFSYECKLVDYLHEGGPAATPTVDGNLVFTFSKEGHVHCLDLATGEVKWKKQLAKELEVEMPVWGFSCSPRVYKDNLIIDAGMTVALNKNNGDVVWKTQQFQPGYGSPTFFEFEKKPVAAVLNNNTLIIVNLEDGTELASTPWETDYVTSACTPVVQVNQIYISTGYKKGCALFEFTGTELKEVYKNKVIRSHMQTPVLIDGHLYGIDGQSNESSRCKLVCQDFATGKMVWEKGGIGCGSVIAADKTLIVLSDKGLLATSEVNPKEFKAISEPAAVVKGKCWTAPVLANGRIFVRTAKGQAVCLDVRKN
jgi:outer membrane protein assembly factor BamB